MVRADIVTCIAARRHVGMTRLIGAAIPIVPTPLPTQLRCVLVTRTAVHRKSRGRVRIRRNVRRDGIPVARHVGVAALVRRALPVGPPGTRRPAFVRGMTPRRSAIVMIGSEIPIGTARAGG